MDPAARLNTEGEAQAAGAGSRTLPLRRALASLAGAFALFLVGVTVIGFVTDSNPDSLLRFAGLAVLDVAVAVWIGLLVRKSPRVLGVVLVWAVAFFVGYALLCGARAVGDLPYSQGVAAARRNDVSAAQRLFAKHDGHYLSPGITLWKGMRITRYGMVQDLRSREASLLGEAALGAGDPATALRYYRESVAVARQNGDASPQIQELADFCDWLDSQIRSGDIWRLMKQQAVATPAV